MGSLPHAIALLVSVAAAGCGSRSETASDAGTAGDAAPNDADAGGACCPMDPRPTACDCVKIGGSSKPGFGCHAVCDYAPVGWQESIDDGGCPVWIPPAGMSCGPGP